MIKTFIVVSLILGVFWACTGRPVAQAERMAWSEVAKDWHLLKDKFK